MRVTKTIKLYCPLPEELLEILELGRQATAYSIKRAIEAGKTSLGGLKAIIYEEVKGLFPGFHSHYAHSAIKWATEIYRAWRKRKRKGKVKGDSPQLTKKGFRFESCLVKVEYQEPILKIRIVTRPREYLWLKIEVKSEYHRALLREWQEGKLKLGELIIKEEGPGQVSVHLPLRKEIEPMEAETSLGVDVNEGSLDWATLAGEAEKIKLEEVNRIFGRHERIVQRATRGKQNPKAKAKVISQHKGRSRRRAEHYLHVAAWRIVRKALDLKATIVLEDLKGIKGRIKFGKKLNRRLHNGWAARKLQALIKEKALWLGVPVMEVSPKNTSKLCPRCGRIGLRRAEGRKVKCDCGYQGDRDITAARNLAAMGTAVSPECGASGLEDFLILNLRSELLRGQRWNIEKAHLCPNIA